MEKHKKYTKAERASWPEGHKRCRSCQEVLPLENFHNHSTGLLGKYTDCKVCRRPSSVKHAAARTFEQTMLASSKHRAKTKGLLHTITIDDIIIPEKCPILNVDIVLVRNHLYSPSLDQKEPGAGYTPENIIVMSRRANTLKNNMSKEEAKLLAEWMNENCTWARVRV